MCHRCHCSSLPIFRKHLLCQKQGTALRRSSGKCLSCTNSDTAVAGSPHTFGKRLCRTGSDAAVSGGTLRITRTTTVLVPSGAPSARRPGNIYNWISGLVEGTRVSGVDTEFQFSIYRYRFRYRLSATCLRSFMEMHLPREHGSGKSRCRTGSNAAVTSLWMVHSLY